MTLTIELPPEKEAVFKAHAQAMGLSIEQWLLRLAEQAGPEVIAPQESKCEPRPVWEVIAENMTHIPPEDLATLPRDGASPDLPSLTYMSV